MRLKRSPNLVRLFRYRSAMILNRFSAPMICSFRMRSLANWWLCCRSALVSGMRDFVFLLWFSPNWCGAVLVDLLDPQVAAICFGVGVNLEVYFGVFEQFVVMGFAFGKMCTDDFFGFLVDS
jgi:hypothetical protein